MLTERRSFTREFKLQAVKMMTDQGLSYAEVARKLGVREGVLGK
jgi:transposase